MGEIADMMLDGTLCSMCGEYLGEDDGYPVMCPSCQREENADKQQFQTRKKVGCPMCGKRVKKVGLDQHIKDVHGEQDE